MSYFFRQWLMKRDWDESQVRRGKTTPESTPGSFAPRATGDKGTPGPQGQEGYSLLAPAVIEALTKVRDTLKRWSGQVTGKSRQPGVTDKETLLKHAAEAKPLYDRLMQGVAGAMSGSLVMGNPAIMDLVAQVEGGTEISTPMILVADIKGGARLESKARTSYNGDWSQMKDMVRGTILVPGASSLDDALETLERTGVRLATRPKDRINEPGNDGYRDLKLNVELDNGHIAELQVMTPAVFVAKMTKAHDYYGEIRELVDELEATGRKPTLDEARRIHENQYRQRIELYDPAWQKDLQK